MHKIFNLRRYFLSFTKISEINIALKTFLLMLIPVLSFILVFELFISKKFILSEFLTYQTISANNDGKAMILYLTCGISHLIISGAVIIFFRNRLYRAVHEMKKKIIVRGFWTFTTGIALLFFLFDQIDVNLAILSHERVYIILKNVNQLNGLFSSPITINLFGRSFELFYKFSTMPFLLILAGLIVIVFTCMNIGKDLAILFEKITIHISTEEMDEMLENIENFHNYIYILSFVLVTSTLATILFFQLPLNFIPKGVLYNSYKSTSLGLGLCWGVIFTLTMLTMCFYPIIAIEKRFKEMSKESENSKRSDLSAWIKKIENNYLIYKNLKSMVSVFSPTIIGLLAPFV